MDLYRGQLKERRQKASETLPELGQAMRRLVNKAYPKAPAKVRESIDPFDLVVQNVLLMLLLS
jgi:hypothetical protein